MGRGKHHMNPFLCHTRYQPTHGLFSYTLFCAYILHSPVSSRFKCVDKVIWFPSILYLVDDFSFR